MSKTKIFYDLLWLDQHNYIKPILQTATVLLVLAVAYDIFNIFKIMYERRKAKTQTIDLPKSAFQTRPAHLRTSKIKVCPRPNLLRKN